MSRHDPDDARIFDALELEFRNGQTMDDLWRPDKEDLASLRNSLYGDIFRAFETIDLRDIPDSNQTERFYQWTNYDANERHRLTVCACTLGRWSVLHTVAPRSELGPLTPDAHVENYTVADSSGARSIGQVSGLFQTTIYQPPEAPNELRHEWVLPTHTANMIVMNTPDTYSYFGSNPEMHGPAISVEQNANTIIEHFHALHVLHELVTTNCIPANFEPSFHFIGKT